MDVKSIILDESFSESQLSQEKDLNPNNEKNQISKSRNDVFSYLPENDTESLRTGQVQKTKLVQNMKDYNFPPQSLPVIVREKELISKRMTMTHFLLVNNYSSIPEEVKKQETHHKVHKKATLQFINNLRRLANINYERKKNQGVMFLNELWGKSYHRSVVFASGLRKNHDKIRGKHMKVAADRVNAVEKYYEDKHIEEIASERRLIESLVLPPEDTESNSELLVKKHASHQELRFTAEKERFSKPRTGGEIDRSYFLYRTGFKGVYSPKRNINSQCSNTLNQTTTPFGESSSTPSTMRNRENSVSSPKFRKFYIEGPKREYFASQTSHEDSTQQEIILSADRAEKLLSNGFMISSARTDLAKATDQNSVKGQTSKELNRQQQPFAKASPQKIKGKDYLESAKKEEIPRSQTLTSKGPFIRKNPSSEPTFSTVISIKNSERDKLQHKFNTKIMSPNKDSKNDLDNTKLPNAKFIQGDECNEKFASVTPISGNFGSSSVKPRSVFTNSTLSTISKPYGMDKSSSSKLKANATRNTFKTEAIESFKNNFLNLVSHCDEISSDKTLRKALKDSEGMFSNRREKKVKELKTNADLEYTIRTMLSKRDSRNQKISN